MSTWGCLLCFFNWNLRQCAFPPQTWQKLLKSFLSLALLVVWLPTPHLPLFRGIRCSPFWIPSKCAMIGMSPLSLCFWAAKFLYDLVPQNCLVLIQGNVNSSLKEWFREKLPSTGHFIHDYLKNMSNKSQTSVGKEILIEEWSNVPLSSSQGLWAGTHLKFFSLMSTAEVSAQTCHQQSPVLLWACNCNSKLCYVGCPLSTGMLHLPEHQGV